MERTYKKIEVVGVPAAQARYDLKSERRRRKMLQRNLKFVVTLR